VSAATLPPVTLDARTVRAVTAAPILDEELPVTAPEEEPRELPPLVLTGDDETDEDLALLRAATVGIHEAQDRVAELSEERKRLVLALRRRTPPVLFRLIADAAGSTDQTIYKIHRDALADERDKVETGLAEQLGYPSLDAFREAREALAGGQPGPYVPPADLHAVDEESLADAQPEEEQ
jgi:hypothetical protein